MYLLQNVFAHIRFGCVCLACQIYRPGSWQGWESERRATMLNCYWNFSGPWRPREIKWSWDAIFSSSLNGVDGFKAEAFHCGEDRSDGSQPILTILVKVTPYLVRFPKRVGEPDYTELNEGFNETISRQMSHKTVALQYQRKSLFLSYFVSQNNFMLLTITITCVKGLCYIPPCPTVKCPASIK